MLLHIRQPFVLWLAGWEHFPHSGVIASHRLWWQWFRKGPSFVPLAYWVSRFINKHRLGRFIGSHYAMNIGIVATRPNRKKVREWSRRGDRQGFAKPIVPKGIRIVSETLRQSNEDNDFIYVDGDCTFIP